MEVEKEIDAAQKFRFLQRALTERLGSLTMAVFRGTVVCFVSCSVIHTKQAAIELQEYIALVSSYILQVSTEQITYTAFNFF